MTPFAYDQLHALAADTEAALLAVAKKYGLGADEATVTYSEDRPYHVQTIRVELLGHGVNFRIETVQ